MTIEMTFVPIQKALHSMPRALVILEGVRLLEGLRPFEYTTVSGVPKLHSPRLNVINQGHGLRRDMHVNVEVVRDRNRVKFLQGLVFKLNNTK